MRSIIKSRKQLAQAYLIRLVKNKKQEGRTIERFYLKERSQTLAFKLSPKLPSGFFSPKRKVKENGKRVYDSVAGIRLANSDKSCGSVRGNDDS